MVKVRDGRVANRPIYAAIDVSLDGEKDVLGLWAGTGGEGAKCWMSGSGTGCAAAGDRRTLGAMAKGFARELTKEAAKWFRVPTKGSSARSISTGSTPPWRDAIS
jgi:hypothetical protein